MSSLTCKDFSLPSKKTTRSIHLNLKTIILIMFGFNFPCGKSICFFVNTAILILHISVPLKLAKILLMTP